MRETLETVKDWASVMAESFIQNDRGAAITAGALVEYMLQLTLEAQWPSLSNRIRSELFENKGPLSTFDAKIVMGYAIGLYGPDIRADLDRIRRIRNSFAHSMKPMTFKSEKVKKICETFQIKIGFSIRDFGDMSSERARFHVVCTYLAALLAHIGAKLPIHSFEEKMKASLHPS